MGMCKVPTSSRFKEVESESDLEICTDKEIVIVSGLRIR